MRKARTIEGSKRILDLTGFRNGKLVAVSFAGLDRRRAAYWICQCDCGRQVKVLAAELRRRTRSCLACSKPSLKHGKRSWPEYSVWRGLLFRCGNPRAGSYPNYGGRGITVCNRWLFGENGKHPFECFLEDMGRRPDPSLSIDRINNDGNYEPGNCRWATCSEQARNQRRQSKRECSNETAAQV